MRQILAALLSVACLVMFAQSASGHTEFKKEMIKKYDLKKVSCNVCHVAKKPKSERNKFGKVLAKAFDGLDLSAGYKAAKKEGGEAKEKFKQKMYDEFKKAMKKIEKMESEKDGPTWGDLIKNGKIEGIELKEKE